MPMTEAAIDPGFHARPVRLARRFREPTAWIVRVQHKPFIDWIWGGCLLMALGGALAGKRPPLQAGGEAPGSVRRGAGAR